MRIPRFFIFFLPLLTSCITFQAVPPLPQNQISSPPYPVNPQVFEIDGKLPKQTLVALSNEEINTEGNLKANLITELHARSLDGAILLHRDYASHEAGRTLASGGVEYYTKHTHFAEYIPFMYLESIEDRAILDSIVLEIEGPAQSKQELYFLFDWQEQLRYIPAQLESEHFTALAIQPWFFLRQTGSAWFKAHSNHPNFNQRRYQSGPTALRYVPSLNLNNVFYLRKPGVDYKLWISLDETQRYRLDSLSIQGRVAQVKRIDFFGRLVSESIEMPSGLTYTFRYFYKRKEDVPANWIIEAKSLQH